MPPTTSHQPETNTDLQLPPGHKSGMGAVIGVVIIVFMLALGGLYFWGAQLNHEEAPLPLIPGDTTTN